MSTIEISEPAMEKAYGEMVKAKPIGGIHYPYNFMQTLLRIDSRRYGFAPGDIETVEALWSSYGEDILWEGGYVLRLRDGRRLYVESYSGAGDWADDASVAVEALAAGLRYPLLGKDHFQTLFGWQDSPDEVNEFLARLAA